jgi:hypothetical protein
MKVRQLLILLLLFISFSSAAQTGQEKINYPLRKKIVVGGIVIQQAASFYIENSWWWKGNYKPFAVINDGILDNYSLGIDKLGHFFISNLYFHTINEAMKWGGFSPTACQVTSVALPMLWAVSIELGDGYSIYGFSFQDLAANALGLGFGLLQNKYKFARMIDFKMSYFPSQRYTAMELNPWAISQDYDGHIYWLAFNIHDMLPSGGSRYWPEFLNLAIGYGVNHFPEIDQMQREFMIGFDYNLCAIKTKKPLLKSGIYLLNRFHLPAPGFKKTGSGSYQPEWLIIN